MDLGSAELLHVDFDCIFDKGLTLRVPEIVPFRLTANMVSGFGVFGHNGSFREVLKITLGLLREHREAILAMLEPFVSDPTVGWERSGRAQRGDADADAGPVTHADRRNEDAKRVLSIVDERLRGIYNVRPQPRSSRAAPPPEQEADSADRVPLSVSGQCDRLIREATASSNLARMFVGWTAHL